ncbi:thioesterase family protein [Nocardia sp. NPDC050697]|uniref:thioesterase family protein n=1 Tax=Nocardia sp. NPDC050697 TaxID=3155158 RepID=UPI0033F325D6
MISADALPLDQVPRGPVTIPVRGAGFVDRLQRPHERHVLRHRRLPGPGALQHAHRPGADYTARTGRGKVIIQSTLGYEHEVLRGSEIEIRSWLLGVDDRRFHVLHEVFSVTDGRRAAVGEQLDLHFDLGTRRTVPMPAVQREYLTRFSRAQIAGGLPQGIGRRVRGPETQVFDE